MRKRDPLTPICMKDRVEIPTVWLIVVSLVIVAAIVHVVMSFFLSGALMIWPFVFAACVLLILNDAADRNAVGVPPFQAYALFGGTLLAFFLFVALVSTLNGWLVVILTLAAAVFLFMDWRSRRERARQTDRRRAAGLCVRCNARVGKSLDDVCPECGLPVNAERLNLFHLAQIVGNQKRGNQAKSVLTGAKPSRSDVKMQQLLQRRAGRSMRKR